MVSGCSVAEWQGKIVENFEKRAMSGRNVGAEWFGGGILGSDARDYMTVDKRSHSLSLLKHNMHELAGLHYF